MLSLNEFGWLVQTNAIGLTVLKRTSFKTSPLIWMKRTIFCILISFKLENISFTFILLAPSILLKSTNKSLANTSFKLHTSQRNRYLDLVEQTGDH
ncbi:hypothetical protein ZIOFF_060395 [Zingiber officinale]|uniref:Uncharacterized protein n=1 Tax=Zingiber officinale TaxID=94328 RepID=A0A8J5FEK0_ZINOF|nr:hypothetical protein ZIOFF_060395 [Zingiber officinale]